MRVPFKVPFRLPVGIDSFEKLRKVASGTGTLAFLPSRWLSSLFHSQFLSISSLS